MCDLQDKVALVTGAGRGLGRGIAEALAERGAIIAANDITPINLDLTLQRIRALGGRAQDYIFDVARQMQVQGMVDQVLADWGRIDVLINAASVRPHAPLLEMDEWDWRRTLDVNLSGPFFLVQQVARAMRQAGGGVIVLIAEDTPTAGVPDPAGYAAFLSSQAGLVSLARQAAGELAPYHIRVHAVQRPRSEAEMAQTVEKVCSQCLAGAANL